MKTLKQILASHYTVFEYDSIELAVKEWLTQKRQEISNEIKLLCGTSPTEATTQRITFLSAKANQIDELLEDLEK